MLHIMNLPRNPEAGRYYRSGTVCVNFEPAGRVKKSKNLNGHQYWSAGITDSTVNYHGDDRVLQYLGHRYPSRRAAARAVRHFHLWRCANEAAEDRFADEARTKYANPGRFYYLGAESRLHAQHGYIVRNLVALYRAENPDHVRARHLAA